MIADSAAKSVRNRQTGLWVSIGALVVTAVFGGATAVMGLFSLAFLDYCRRRAAAPTAQPVIGLAVTVIQLVRRKPGWPFAVATFVLCALAVVLGGVGYAMAVS